MPLYTYRCSHCGIDDEFFFNINDPLRDDYDAGQVQHTPPLCDGVWRRTYTSFSVPSNPFGDGYFDHGVGAFVNNKKQLDDINKAKSEAHTARTGVETNFVAHRIEDAAPRMGPQD